MKKNLYIIFKQAIYYPENQLSDDIFRAINNKEAKSAKIKLWIYSSAVALSLAGLIPAIKDLSLQFSNSGFYEYLSLAFSSNGSIISYWKEFMLSLADSLPVESLMFSLLLLFIFFISTRLVMRQFKDKLLTA
ncbi:MAG TPA: hypothetical protein VMR49_01840 [Candidatus Paceibacterota bacterium]|jgi:hypothetical protein|nr:hypothetical protein [Candidatus Paceibacterota bacterium]